MTTTADVDMIRASASQLLTRNCDALAGAVTAALYAASPALLERHGERGREKCLQDMRHNIEYVVAALDLGDGAVFSRYVEWLETLLRVRHVDTRDMARSLTLLQEECAGRFARPEADAIGAMLQAGLHVLTTRTPPLT